ncbi:hypothetical protein ANOM_000516 [Aspergillus nomiae NRRL 13137]|uniref:Uncharacterized protein n=1 Tax=Aspergillus nomiae NRRL (strain ATCC 15546 / NRRL 13137 / CBS 260.88 / M93) TaxID=1509407 RepID=A0A0L1JJ25_ASPN3|nr:uncharacterized protein ANOM_000516 [Aspergillus nomiae NRRL 13137]KNG91393.1 hypothetical protein ANOM_000516 [Aspergillus nomiae NRRL 13137]
MFEQGPPKSPRLQAECNSRVEPGGERKMGTWTASIPSRSDLTSKHYVPSSPLSHLEPARGHEDTHYDTANRPQSPVWNPLRCPINSDLSIGLDVDPTECNLSDEAALEASRPETGSAPAPRRPR